MKRILLFVLTNFAVMIVLSIVATLLGFNRFGGPGGLNLATLLGFAAVFGFGGAFVSLLLSKWSARMAVGAEVIHTPAGSEQAWLLATVRRLADKAGIGMPEVAIYDAAEINACATGASRNHALVAVSSGLLRQMSRDEAEAVLAHEVSHVANGDMVTLTLLQGVLNTFVIFLSRIVGHVVDRALGGEGEERSSYGVGYYVTYFVLEIVLGVLASLIVMWFSRQREFRADAGAGRLSSRAQMIAALERLKLNYDHSELPPRVTAFGIKGGRTGVMQLFASHPSLDERIAALQQSR